MHIFNVWTMIRQSLNIKEWNLLELGITQTRHPKSVADRLTGRQTDGQTDGRTDGQSGPTSRPAFAKATQVKKRERNIVSWELDPIGHNFLDPRMFCVRPMTFWSYLVIHRWLVEPKGWIRLCDPYEWPIQATLYMLVLPTALIY